MLRSTEALNFDIDDSSEPATWDQVFDTCGELLAPGSVEFFFVGRDDWLIMKAGGVIVEFTDIPLQGAEVNVQLIGDEFDFVEPFLPEKPGDTRVFTLSQGKINGRSDTGGPGGSQGCQLPGNGTPENFNLLSPSTLVITAVAVP